MTLSSIEKRYDFGRNWQSYAENISNEAIYSAQTNLKRILGNLEGKTVLDIGSGSGLHALAAIRLKADYVDCIDYDNDSVKTTGYVLRRYASNDNWSVRQGDILNPKSFSGKKYDIVYSWGVLHHTGDMWQAIENASTFVKPDGKLLIALYIRTPLCKFWKTEKYIYSHYPYIRPLIRYPYAISFLIGQTLMGCSPSKVKRDYQQKRGMSFMHDVDDWLGGYPYQSTNHKEVANFMEKLGFSLDQHNKTKRANPVKWLFGTHCGEWLFTKSETK